jgi:hypothetical protein
MTTHDQALEALSVATKALWEAITSTSAAKVELEKVRGSRGSSPDSIMDAAMGFRKQEAALLETLGKVVEAQAKVLGLQVPM